MTSQKPIKQKFIMHLGWNFIAQFSMICFCTAKVISNSGKGKPKPLLKLIENRSLYDPNVLPSHNKKYPTNVTISMYIEGLSSFQASTMNCEDSMGASAIIDSAEISATMCQKVSPSGQDASLNMDFHVDIYFQERWADERLVHPGPDHILIKDLKMFDKIWHPDLYFANARTSEFHYVTAPNFFAWIYPNGTVYYDTRISLTVMCMMNLFKYPLDEQRCEIRILSYAYDLNQLKIEWLSTDPIISNDIKLPDMELETILTGECVAEYVIGKWSCKTAVFIVKREIMHHILQSYIPTALMVVISWFSFWLDVDSVPGRVSLCITTLLTLATQASAARLALPQVSYIKAIDVWMGTCLAFVFGVMIEFTIVNYWSRHKPLIKSESTQSEAQRFHNYLSRPSTLRQRFRRRLKMTNGNLSLTTSENPGTPELESKPSLAESNLTLKPTSFLSIKKEEERRRSRLRVLVKQKNRKTAMKIDQICRVSFPVTFTVFNLLYWPYYLYVAENKM